MVPKPLVDVSTVPVAHHAFMHQTKATPPSSTHAMQSPFVQHRSERLGRTVSGEGQAFGAATARPIHVLATTLTGLSAGFFFAYESSVIRGLADVDDVTYVATFQAINATIRNPMFGLVFFGSLPVAIAAAAINWRASDVTRRILLVAAPLLYIIGMAITFTGNVVLNNELAEVEVTSAAVATQARADFEDDWNRLDGYRSLAFLGGFVALAGSLATGTSLARSGEHK